MVNNSWGINPRFVAIEEQNEKTKSAHHKVWAFLFTKFFEQLAYRFVDILNTVRVVSSCIYINGNLNYAVSAAHQTLNLA
ncbi:hypothetical protein DXX93_16135 [Thalassotalea euphylliae]|uniref:Uncharacterized protein n=1 Tax=Thalassotalea euphylliae TaxID=1655234 RepID=A0A3E0TTY9_9GAMM|nr:hypothetical protein DXX93_16135 [Thalassotalea euphylliae]